MARKTFTQTFHFTKDVSIQRCCTFFTFTFILLLNLLCFSYEYSSCMFREQKKFRSLSSKKKQCHLVGNYVLFACYISDTCLTEIILVLLSRKHSIERLPRNFPAICLWPQTTYLEVLCLLNISGSLLSKYRKE